MGSQILRYTHTRAQVATQPKCSNKPLPEKQSKRSLDSCKCTSHEWIHSPVFNKVQAPTAAFSILGSLSTSLPWTLWCLMRVTLKLQPLPYDSMCTHIHPKLLCKPHFLGKRS